MNKKIIFSSGGTGGHLFPAINMMKHFSNKGYEVLLVTDPRGSSFIKNHTKFRTYIIKAESPINKSFFKKIFSYLIVFYSIIKSVGILIKEKPNLTFGFGGYVSFPISIVSKLFNLPLVTYENNAVLGRANKYLLPFTKKIFLASNTPINFPHKYKNKILESGYILDKDIINYLNKENKVSENFSILVLGGSQGAEVFGKIVPPVIKMIREKGHNIEIVQQCTDSQKKYIEEFYNKNNIKNKVFDFSNNILDLISSASMAISRCGASTMAELVHVNTPFIAVPIPQSIDNHQLLNAKHYENKGCCWVIEQSNFNPNNLFNLIIKVMENKKELFDMQKNMKKNINNEVYTKIENEIKILI